MPGSNRTLAGTKAITLILNIAMMTGNIGKRVPDKIRSGAE